MLQVIDEVRETKELYQETCRRSDTPGWEEKSIIEALDYFQHREIIAILLESEDTIWFKRMAHIINKLDDELLKVYTESSDRAKIIAALAPNILYDE